MGASLRSRLTDECIAPMQGGEVYIYRLGSFSASVCAPAFAEGEDVAAAVQQRQPAGTDMGWQVSRDATFAEGEPNPCGCEEDAERKHWLLDC